MDKKTVTTAKTVAAVAAGAAAVAGVVTAGTRAWRRKRSLIIHAEPNGNGWQLMVEGNKNPSKTFETKEDAVAAGRDMARDRAPSELVIHRSDGSEQARHAYEI